MGGWAGSRGTRKTLTQSHTRTVRQPPPNIHTETKHPPNRYMLFLLNGEVPCTKASWIQLTL